MTLLVFSDSHYRPQHMMKAAEKEAPQADACFHLGDGVSDADLLQKAYPALPLYTVQGNCDPRSLEPYEGLAPFAGLLIFYCHGHQLQVKQDVEALWWRAHEQKADIVLFGHTHVPYHEYKNGIHLFNPGSIGMPRFGAASYGRITIHDGQPTFDIIKVK